jgi:hypothetical protein
LRATAFAVILDWRRDVLFGVRQGMQELGRLRPCAETYRDGFLPGNKRVEGVDMKIFVFNHKGDISKTGTAVAIVSKNIENAKAIYEKETDGYKNYEVKECEIVEGLQLWANGYDDESISIQHA